jgi:TetR/AcrR family transcriptional repressor of nem operon
MDDHILLMSKITNRDKLLTEGLRVVHERGFASASVRDIVKAAGVPQGSFTNHFASKEAFGLEVIDLYYARIRALMAETLLNEGLPPLQRLAAYIDINKNRLGQDDMKHGCLVGNFTAESGAQTDAIRERLAETFVETQAALAACLRAAVTAGELPAATDCDELAGFILSSIQGATLLAKATRSAAPIERFKRILFANVLRQP